MSKKPAESSFTKLVCSPKEVAKMSGLHLNTVYTMIWAGELPAQRIGRQFFLPLAKIKKMFLGGEE